MNKKTRILSDLSKIASNTFGTISGLKKELETIIKIRIEKAINKANLIKRDEFEVLKMRVEKLSKKNTDLERLLKLKNKKKQKK